MEIIELKQGRSAPLNFRAVGFQHLAVLRKRLLDAISDGIKNVIIDFKDLDYISSARSARHSEGTKTLKREDGRSCSARCRITSKRFSKSPVRFFPPMSPHGRRPQSLLTDERQSLWPYCCPPPAACCRFAAVGQFQRSPIKPRRPNSR